MNLSVLWPSSRLDAIAFSARHGEGKLLKRYEEDQKQLCSGFGLRGGCE
jgi:hypothetical protein